MKVNIKAKVRPANELVKLWRAEGLSHELDIEMFEYADREVTIIRFVEDDPGFVIKEDGGAFYWDPALFVTNIPLPSTADVELSRPIDDNKIAYVEFNGQVSIGCASIPFKDVKKIYEACAEQVKKFDHFISLSSKPKKKRKKKRGK